MRTSRQKVTSSKISELRTLRLRVGYRWSRFEATRAAPRWAIFKESADLSNGTSWQNVSLRPLGGTSLINSSTEIPMPDRSLRCQILAMFRSLLNPADWSSIRVLYCRNSTKQEPSPRRRCILRRNLAKGLLLTYQALI